MAVVISVILIMFIMLAAVTLPLTADVSSSIRLGKVADQRQLAESVMNELFSQAAKSSDLNLGFQMVGRVDPGARSVDDAGATAGWAKYVPGTGSFVACGSITELCFFYSPQLTSGSPFVTVEVTTRSACRADGSNCVFRRFQQSWRRRGFVDYVIFTDMETLQPELYGSSPGLRVVRPGGGAAVFVDYDWAKKHCGDRYIDNGAGTFTADTFGDVRGPALLNDISRRQTNAASAPLQRYLWPHRAGNDPSNPLSLTEEFSLTVQPTDRRHENCFDIAYTGGSVGDQVNGPIHTNDYWFWYCGSPVFNDLVEATGDPAGGGTVRDQVFKQSQHAGCIASGSPNAGNPVNARIGSFLKLPSKLDRYPTLASTTLTPTSGQKVRVKLVPGSGGKRMLVSLDGAVPATQMDVPSRGVVYVPASVSPGLPNVLEIEGEGADVTFVSEDNLRVVGDITQPALSPGVTLGFVAGGSITIDQTPNPPLVAGPRLDRYVTGAFLSLSGMSVNGWNDVADASLATHPTLHLTGAIIAKYRPVFGTYNSAGDLQTGMRKHIRYPTDSKSAQIPPTPPYFVQPVNAVWVRLDFTETPLLAGSPGLTRAPASPPQSPAGACPPSVTWPTGEANAYVPSCLLNP